MQTALNIAQLFAAVMWLAFSVWYMVRATWWKSAFGWNTLLVSLTVTILLIRLAFLTYSPNYKTDLIFTGFSIYILFGGLGLHRLILLEKAQRQGVPHAD